MVENTKKLVKRTIFPEIAKHLEAEEITLIVGARQVGKTTLLSQLKKDLLDKGYPENSILAFNLDLISERQLFESQREFIAFLKERVGKGEDLKTIKQWGMITATSVGVLCGTGSLVFFGYRFNAISTFNYM